MAHKENMRLEELMDKHINRTCTIEEKEELLNLLNDTQNPEIIDKSLKNLWDNNDLNIRLDNLSWEIIKEIHNTRKNNSITKVPFRKKVYRYTATAAAIFITLCLIAGLYHTSNRPIIYETGYGEVKTIILNDGTKVDLNANSRLTWDKNWKKKGAREALLIGEANFNVEKIKATNSLNDEQVPFKVYTTDLRVNVLGTNFRVSNRRNKTEVFLKQGSVEVLLYQKDRKSIDLADNDEAIINTENSLNIESSSKTKITLTPNEYISYSISEEELIHKKVDSEKYSSDWRKGVLSYYDVPFNEMLQNLEDIFGHNFIIENKSLIDKRVDFNIPYKSWETVKSMLETMLSIEITELDNHTYKIE